MHVACVSIVLHDEEIYLLRIAPMQWEQVPVKSNNAWDCDSWSVYLNAYLTDAIFDDVFEDDDVRDVRRSTMMDTRDRAHWSIDRSERWTYPSRLAETK